MSKFNTPWRLEEREAFPFAITIIDAAGSTVLTEQRYAWSSRMRTLESLRFGDGFDHGEERENAVRKNEEQLARLHFIVDSVNQCTDEAGK